jgi:hypothetical protein
MKKYDANKKAALIRVQRWLTMAETMMDDFVVLHAIGDKQGSKDAKALAIALRDAADRLIERIE